MKTVKNNNSELGKVLVSSRLFTARLSTILKKYFTTIVGSMVTLGVVLSVSSCTDGAGSIAGTGGVNGSGFVDGIGSGEITDFGSVIFTDSKFETTSDTVFTIDDNVVVESSLGRGMIASFEIENSNDNLTAGTAQQISASTVLKGVVTGVNPLTVLGQNIFVTGDTVLENISGNDLNNLTTNDLVEVYGLIGNDNIVRATRIEQKTLSGLVEWKLSGNVSGLSSTTLTIGTQLVNIDGLIIDDCTGGLSIGDFVEIKADPNSSFGSGDTLQSVTKLECVLNAIPIPGNPSANVIRAEFEGIVSGYTIGALNFTLGNQVVNFTNATEFRSGTIDDLVDGTRLEAEGFFDTSTGILSADEIKFRQARVRIEAGVEPADINTSQQSLVILGITVQGSPATEDDDAILSSVLSSASQVEVRGFVDGSGVIFAERIRNRGVVDNDDILLRGPVENVSNPNFTILGVTVNALGASSYLDLNEDPLAGISAFFGLLSDGVIVEVEDAKLDTGPGPGPALIMDGNSTVQLED